MQILRALLCDSRPAREVGDKQSNQHKMEHINKIEIRGTVGSVRIQNFEERQAANFSVVTNYIYKSRNGEAVIETCWFNVSAWQGRSMPDNLEDIRKGQTVHVTGRMREREYTGTDGTVRRVMEVVAGSVELVSEDGRLNTESR